MSLRPTLSLLAALILTAAPRARAQMFPPARAQASTFRVELAPFAGFCFGGSLKNSVTGDGYSIKEAFSYGGTLELALSHGNRLSVLYSRTETEIDTIGGSVPMTLQYVHVGGTRDMRSQGQARPYVSGALGLALADAPGTGVDGDTKFGLSGGIGLRTPGASRLAIRAEARGYATFVGDQNAAGTCGGSGCAIVFQSGVLLQGELALGLGFRF